MSSLIAKPYRKLDQDKVDTKIPDEIQDDAKSPENVENSDTSSAKSKGDSEGNWEKRYKDLQSFHDREVAKLKQDLSKVETESFSPPTTPEEMEAFKEKHRDVYNVMITLAYEEARKATGRVKQEVDSLTSTTKKTASQMAKEAIVKAHPDFGKISQSQEFHEWAGNQIPEIQNWIYKNPDNAALAIKALDMFKAETGYKNEADSKKKERASDPGESVKISSTPDVKGGEKVWKASDIKKLSPAQFEKYEADIDKAMAENRIDFNN